MYLLKRNNEARMKMKTFTKITEFPKGSAGNDKGMRRVDVIWEDPKRLGLYRWTEFQVGSGKPKQYSVAYGKSNQQCIIDAAKNMIEVI